jgi:hypothetical protein
LYLAILHSHPYHFSSRHQQPSSPTRSPSSSCRVAPRHSFHGAQLAELLLWRPPFLPQRCPCFTRLPLPAPERAGQTKSPWIHGVVEARAAKLPAMAPSSLVSLRSASPTRCPCSMASNSSLPWHDAAAPFFPLSLFSLGRQQPWPTSTPLEQAPPTAMAPFPVLQRPPCHLPSHGRELHPLQWTLHEIPLAPLFFPAVQLPIRLPWPPSSHGRLEIPAASPLPRCSSWCPPAVRQNAQQAARCSSPPIRSPLPSSRVVALVLAAQPHPRRRRNPW